MKIKDFENAIDSINGAITIDEMVLRKGHVSAVYGHSCNMYIKWNLNGTCYTAKSKEELTSKVQDTRNKVSAWERNSLYDLKFQ